MRTQDRFQKIANDVALNLNFNSNSITNLFEDLNDQDKQEELGRDEERK